MPMKSKVFAGSAIGEGAAGKFFVLKMPEANIYAYFRATVKIRGTQRPGSSQREKWLSTLVYAVDWLFGPVCADILLAARYIAIGRTFRR